MKATAIRPARLASWGIAFAALLLNATASAWAATPIRVAYAGSMGAVMDQKIGPAFAKAHDAEYQGIGQASYALAHLLEKQTNAG